MAVAENCIIRSPHLHETRFEAPHDFHVHVDDGVPVFLYETHGALTSAGYMALASGIAGVVLVVGRALRGGVAG